MIIKKTYSALSLISNIGVLIGFILLAFELHQNSSIAHINSYQNLVSHVNHVNELRATDQVLAALIIRANSGETLTELEHNQYLAFWKLSINSGRLAHKQFDSGLINVREMEGLLGPVRDFLEPQIGQRLWKYESQYYSVPFRRHISAMMAERLPDNEYWATAINEI